MKMVKIRFNIPQGNRGPRVQEGEFTEVIVKEQLSKPANKRAGAWKYAEEIKEDEVIDLGLEDSEVKSEVVTEPKRRGPKPKVKEEDTLNKGEDEI